MAPRNTPEKFPVSSGLLEAKHVAAIDRAVWTFLVLVDWQTGDDGAVMNGAEIQAAAIAARLGTSEHTVRRELDRLEAGHYIRRKRSRTGWLVWISKPKRAPSKANKRRSRSAKYSDPDRPNSMVEIGQICTPDRPNRVLRAGIENLTPDSGKKEDPEKTLTQTLSQASAEPEVLSPSNGFEDEFENLKRAYPKDTLVNAHLTDYQFSEVVLSAANPQAVMAEVWAGLERMKASGTQVRFMPTLKDFLRDYRFREQWPREVADDQLADVDAIMEAARARRRAEQEASR